MREVTRRAAQAWQDAPDDVKAKCRELAVVAKKKHEEVYGPPPKRTRKRRNNTKRNEIPLETTAPIPDTSLIFPNPPTPFYLDEIMAPPQFSNWQTEISYEIFSPTGSDGDSPHHQFTTIYTTM